MQIKSFFDSETATLTHLLMDESTSCTAIIDPVLNFDAASGSISTKSADEIIAFCKKEKLNVEWLLETHPHADHLTAAAYLQKRVGGKIGIGSGISAVLAYWVPVLNTHTDTPLDGSQFDKLFEDQEIISLGQLKIKILHTPGHTPACICYSVENALFGGDVMLMPDIGTGRTDFPGGDANTLYNSLQKILSLPAATRYFPAHDYPGENKSPRFETTLQLQKEQNPYLQLSREQFIEIRCARDHQKPAPRLLLPALQVNLRAGEWKTLF